MEYAAHSVNFDRCLLPLAAIEGSMKSPWSESLVLMVGRGWRHQIWHPDLMTPVRSYLVKTTILFNLIDLNSRIITLVCLLIVFTLGVTIGIVHVNREGHRREWLRWCTYVKPPSQTATAPQNRLFLWNPLHRVCSGTPLRLTTCGGSTMARCFRWSGIVAIWSICLFLLLVFQPKYRTCMTLFSIRYYVHKYVCLHASFLTST